MSGLLLDFGFEPDDKARAVPNLYVLAVEELLGLLRRFLIVGTLDNFGRSTDVPGAVYRIDAIRGHVGRSWRQAIRAKAAQRRDEAHSQHRSNEHGRNEGTVDKFVLAIGPHRKTYAIARLSSVRFPT